MRHHALKATGILAVLATVGLLAIAAPAQAMYIETPLALQPDRHQAEVGDEVSFTVDAQNESAADEWAGKRIHVRYAYDAEQGEEGQDGAWPEKDLLAELTLDDKAHATFTWTVPEEVQDRNVDIRLIDDAGENLGTTHLAVGNATPMMRAMSGSGSDSKEISGGGDSGLDTSSDDASDAPRSTVPAAGTLALVGTAAVAAIGIGITRRRRD